jgi:hypothetical protein
VPTNSIQVICIPYCTNARIETSAFTEQVLCEDAWRDKKRATTSSGKERAGAISKMWAPKAKKKTERRAALAYDLRNLYMLCSCARVGPMMTAERSAGSRKIVLQTVMTRASRYRALRERKRKALRTRLAIRCT